MLQSWNESRYSFDSGSKRAQYILSPAFHRMGGNIDYGALCANTPSMQRLCKSLGAKPLKGRMYMDALIHLSDTLNDNDLIRGMRFLMIIACWIVSISYDSK